MDSKVKETKKIEVTFECDYLETPEGFEVILPKFEEGDILTCQL